MNKLLIRFFGLPLLAVYLAACQGPSQVPTRGVYMLIDTSGTYTAEIDKAQQIISYLLSRLHSGDALAVARIDTASFSEDDIIAKTTFEDRPSVANQQKRRFVETIQAFVKNAKPSGYTDVTGGILQGIEWLNEHQTDRKIIIIFSDLKEDLPEGYVRDIALPLVGIDVIAVNVTKLRSDNVDPREYMDRLAQWEKKVKDGGGDWRVINDLERLEKLLPQ